MLTRRQLHGALQRGNTAQQPHWRRHHGRWEGGQRYPSRSAPGAALVVAALSITAARRAVPLVGSSSLARDSDTGHSWDEQILHTARPIWQIAHGAIPPRICRQSRALCDTCAAT